MYHYIYLPVAYIGSAARVYTNDIMALQVIRLIANVIRLA